MDYQALTTVRLPIKHLGVWSIKHKPSGKVIIGSTTDIAKQKRYQTMLLLNGKHKTPEFQTLFNITRSLDDLSFSFGLVTDEIELKSVYEQWVKKAINEGVYLTARKGKSNDEADAVGKTSGMYIINFTNTGLFYVGSSGRMKRRLSQHKSMLKNGTNTCRLLQEAYNHDSTYKVITKFTDTLEEARLLEQEYIDSNKGNPLMLNIATDVNAPCRNLHDNPEWHNKILESAAKARRTSDSRKAYGERMRKWHAEHKGNRDGANNPFAKKVKMFGVGYGSVMDAIRTGILPASVVRRRLKDNNDHDIVYCT